MPDRNHANAKQNVSLNIEWIDWRGWGALALSIFEGTL